MKASSKSLKIIAATAGLSSFVVLAGVVHDIQRNTPSFMETAEVQYTSRLDDHIGTSRQVASERAEKEKKPAIQYIGFNEQNRQKLNGQWEILRITNTNGKVHFDSERPEDENMEINVDVKMVGTSMVVLDEDSGLEYDISYLHESAQAMAIFREMDGGYEVIEARKVFRQESRSNFAMPSPSTASEVGDKIFSPAKGVEVEGFYDLSILSAIDVEVTPNVMRNETVYGSLRIGDGEIEQLNLSLHEGTEYEKSLSLNYVRIEDGGVFSSQGVTGVVLNNGEDSFKVRFTTGPLKDVQAIFVTDEELRRVQEVERNNQYRESASSRQEGFQYQDNTGNYYEDDHHYIDETHRRDNGYMSIEDMEFEREQQDFDTVEARQEHAEQTGFTFTSGEPTEATRSPASK